MHIETIDNLTTFVTEKLGAYMNGVTYSPIHKNIGNIEYLLWLTMDPDTQPSTFRNEIQQTTAEVVTEAHDFFQNNRRQ